MTKETAVRLLELAGRCTNAILATIEVVRQKAPGRGADLFESVASSVCGKLVVGFMSGTWDQYPDLRDGPEIQPGEAYDPDSFNLPKDVVVETFRSLGQVQQEVRDIRALIRASELEPKERSRFEGYLAEVEGDL